MTYLDTSVALAHLPGVDRAPPRAAQSVSLASYDERVLEVARALGIDVFG